MSIDSMSSGSVPLVAVAHGSRDPRAAATVEALLEGVRLARPDIPVRTAYLDHAPPSLTQAISSLTDSTPSTPGVEPGSRGLWPCEAVVLPLLLTEAYHSRVDIPGALREVAARHPRLRVHYGTTLGPHPSLVRALERRLAEAGVATGDPEAAVVLVSAGSSDRRANAVVARMARRWARERGWWSVTAAYASAASPTPEQEVARLRRAGAPRVVVAPYLLAPGHFADKIRHTALAAGAATVADVLGAAPEVVTVVLDRYGQAAQVRNVSASA
jgi:sirohydrochlorin ferrochelatase